MVDKPFETNENAQAVGALILRNFVAPPGYIVSVTAGIDTGEGGADARVIGGGSSIGDAGAAILRGGDSVTGQGGGALIQLGEGVTNGNLQIINIPSTDPNVAWGVWQSNGMLMMSGSTPPPSGGLTATQVATLIALQGTGGPTGSKPKAHISGVAPDNTVNFAGTVGDGSANSSGRLEASAWWATDWLLTGMSGLNSITISGNFETIDFTGSTLAPVTNLQIMGYNGQTPAITSINLSGFVGVSEATLANLPALTALNLSTWAGLNTLTAHEIGASLVSIDLSGCTNFATGNLWSNSALTTVTLPAAWPVNLTFLNINDCALSEATVDALLALAAASAVDGGDMNLADGTSAPPSATGLTAKGVLEGRGWTIGVN